MSDCIFCKIANKAIPTKPVYEDEHVLAFHDLNPQAPVHVLIVPKIHIETTNDLAPEHAPVLTAMFTSVPKIACDLGIARDGYRLVLNCNKNGLQSVFHIHIHMLGGRLMKWPPG